VTHIEAIPDVNWGLVGRGQDIFLERCGSCHGPFGRGSRNQPDGPAPPDLSAPAFQRRTRDDDIVRVIRAGHRGMPAVPTLRSDADVRVLLAFVRVLSPGFELYSRHCAPCHGDDGHPQREFVEARQRPPVVFDRPWLERRDPGQLRAAVSHMLEERTPGMPHFRATLSDAEARAILRYLRAPR
jgi:mono/diheme cytochrome c family protein